MKDSIISEVDEEHDLGDFPDESIADAVEAMHGARTGSFYDGRPLHHQRSVLVLAFPMVVQWFALRDRLAIEVGEATRKTKEALG